MKYKLKVIIFASVMILVCCVLGVVSEGLDNKGVIITEVCNDYGNVLYDADGACHGFVELYNNSDDNIDLTGWYISDSTNNRFKYKVDDCIVKPYEYVVFWSSEISDVIEIIDKGNFLGYSLDKGESVVLSKDDGTVIDKVRIPDLPKGKTYSKDINKNLWYESQATPNGINGNRISHKKISKPVFSKKSGFYDDVIELKIKADNGCKIYYTLDGTQPTINSKLYTEAITLSDNSNEDNKWSSLDNITFFSGHVPQTDLKVAHVIPSNPVPKINVVKAIAVDKSGNTSECSSASYIVGYRGKYGFDNADYGFENTMVMSISTNEDNLFGNKIGVYIKGHIWDEYKNEGTSFPYTAYTNYSVSGKGWRRPAEIELFDENHNLIATQEAAISIHGGWSVTYNQKSFNIYAQPNESGKEILLGSLFSGNQRSLMLRAGGFRDLYSTKIRDVLNMKMMQDTNVLATDFVPCQVFINGEYWGLYNLQERIDANLILGHYGVNPENVIVLKNYNVVSGEVGEEQLFRDVVEYAAENDLSKEENYEKICGMIDIESCIDYYIFQTYVANCDSIANNYSVWRSRNIVDDKYGDGKWRWILYDTDDSANMVDGLTQPEVDSFVGGHWTKAPMQDELFAALIENEEFKIKFAERFIYLANNNFSYENVENIISEFEKKYVPAVTVSHRRFKDENYPESEYYEQLDRIKDFYRERYDYIYQYMVENLKLKKYGY